MRITIMQPYFLPYIGYFQLINAVDKFVVYDDIKYTKKGWINRNRILVNGKDEFITLPLRKDSDYLDVHQRFLSGSFQQEKEKIIRRIHANYRRSPYFNSVIELLKEIFEFNNKNLFDFILNSLQAVCSYLNIKTDFVISSTLTIDPHLKGQSRVLAICKKMEADCYINPIGGMELYSREEFALNRVTLKFLQPNLIIYPQLGLEFVPNLSILDVLMFNDKEKIAGFLRNEYKLV